MSYNKRATPKRGGRYKNNFVDNGGVRRSNVESHIIPATTQLRPVAKFLNNEGNNIPNISDFYDDPTTLYLLCKYYLGNYVTIKTDTEELNGVLKAVSPNGDFCLTEATVFAHNVEFISRNEKFKMIPIKDIRLVEVKNVETDCNTYSPEIDKILTDDDIARLHRSRNGADGNYDENGTQEVELTPFYDGTVPHDDNCLNANKIGAHWFPPEEMFEKNKMRFNVQSTYSDDLDGYTTKLHKDDPNYQKDLMMAHRKALEIEKDRSKNFDDLENDDETNEEFLFCSVNRSTESPHNAVLNNKARTSELSSLASPHSHNTLNSSQESNDLKHFLNPNAREFTPISSSGSNYEPNNASIYNNSMNIQPQPPFANFFHPPNLMPYPVSVMLPPPPPPHHHHQNHLPMIHTPGMEHYIIPRPNFLPNYAMSPFIVPNQCQISFDPNMMSNSNTVNNKCENNYQNMVYSSPNDAMLEEDISHSEANNRTEICDELQKEDSDKYRDKYDDDTQREQNGELNSSSNQKMIPFNSGVAQPMYGQVQFTGTNQAYLLPANMAHGIRNISGGPYPQMMPPTSHTMSYIPNYFSRQAPPPSLVAPFHQLLPNGQVPSTLPFQMKPMSAPTNNFQTAYQPNPSFVPIMNPIPGHNFQAFIPGYGPSMVPAQINSNSQIQIPIHQNMPQFPQFIGQIQPFNYFATMQPASIHPQPPPSSSTQQQ